MLVRYSGFKLCIFIGICILSGCAASVTDVPEEYQQQLDNGKIVSVLECEPSIWLSEDEKYLLEIGEESVNLICKYQDTSIYFTLSEMEENTPGTYWYHADDEQEDRAGMFWGNVQQEKFVCYKFPDLENDGKIDRVIFHKVPSEQNIEKEKEFFDSIRPTKHHIEIDKQISVIANHSKQWLQQDRKPPVTKYMVSDFNQDGILELIAYSCSDNFHVDIQIWEVDISEQELVNVDENGENYVPQIDMGINNTFLYFEQKKRMYYYCFLENPVKKSQMYQVVAYQEGVLKTFGDEQIFLKTFSHLLKYDVTFGWFESEEAFSAQSTEELGEILLKSYNQFKRE